MTELQFRPATPDDASAVVPVIYQASKVLFDTLVKRPKDDPEAFLRHDYLRGDGMFGYRNQVVGTVGGQVVCSATMYAGSRYRELQRALMKSAATYFNPLKLIGIVARSRPFDQMFVDPRPDALFVANGGVVAGQRSEGAFTALLEHAVARARSEGLKAVEFDVNFSDDARAAYERAGFAVTAEVLPPRDAGFEGFHRMARSLA
jgi:GNAT superfamily N-acetyltransferase